MTEGTATVILGLVTAFGSLVAAVAAWRAASHARTAVEKAAQALEAQIFISFREQYASPEFMSALQAIAHWKATYGDNFVREFARGKTAVQEKKSFANDEEEWRAVNDGRRIVKNYFLRVLELLELGAIGKQTADRITSISGRDLMHYVVEDLELALDPKSADRQKIARFKESFPPLEPPHGAVRPSVVSPRSPKKEP